MSMPDDVLQKPQEMGLTGQNEAKEPIQTPTDDGGVKRAEDGRLLPGTKPLNPGGRPKNLSITAMLRERLKTIPKGQEKPYLEMLIERMLNQAIVIGDFQTLKLLMNYLEGMPKQSIEHDANVESYTAILRNLMYPEESKQITDDENNAFNEGTDSGVDGARPENSQQTAPATGANTQPDSTSAPLPPTTTA